MTVKEQVTADWQDALNFLLGAGLFFSPWLLGFETEQAVAWNAHLVGAIIAVMALMALFAFHTWEEWVSGAFGAWLIAAPWVLGFNTFSAPTLTHVVVGLVTVVMAIWSTYEHGSSRLTA